MSKKESRFAVIIEKFGSKSRSAILGNAKDVMDRIKKELTTLD